MDNIALGKRIKECRISRKLTQEKLAELSSLSTPYISNIETANTKMSLSTLVKIANILGVTPNFLLQDSLSISNEKQVEIFLDRFRNFSVEEITLAEKLLVSIFDVLEDTR